jgi:2,4-dienoyl-CoA reductase-like NADH-dependent reductase (Old Yellow Enzyme family)
MALEHVLSPLTVNGVELPNRVVRTAHGTNIGRGRVDDDLIAYHLARGRGGVGLSILEAASVHRTDTGTLRIHDDSCIADFGRLTAAIRPTGMRMFQQLGHLGHDGTPMDDGVQPWSASAVRSPNYGWTAHAMTLDEIEEMIECFARAAVWGREGGLDGVEIHAAHGYLLQEFQSPVTNLRTDRYGGSTENRMRFTLDVLRAVRAAVGPDYVVGVRTGADGTDDGVDAEDCAELVRVIEAAGLVDYVNVTFGSCRRSHKIIGAMHEPTGYELATSEVVTKATRLPTLVTGRFRTLAEADEVIANGLADLVGMTRAHIADPDIVRKTVAGRAHEVRPCIACNQGCVGGLSLGRLGCAVNADVGFEREHEGAYDRVDEPRTVLVVGGGPSGMEAARVAAVRGHRVVLCEAGPALGGNIASSRRFPNHELIGDSIDWLSAELERLQVEVRCSTRVDARLAAELAPDRVILATGARPLAAGTQWTSVDVAALDAPPPGVRSVVIEDRFGGYEVIGVAERLVDWGIAVTVVTPFEMLAPRIMRELVLVPALERLERAPGPFTVVTGADRAGPLPDADAVVLIDKVSPPAPFAVSSWDPTCVHVVGDAAEPGHLWSAIRSGNEAGRLV